MLPRRRLMLGLIISLVILLFYLSETAFWQEYLFSPQLVVWDKRVWLVYARNPLLGRGARLRVRPLEGGRVVHPDSSPLRQQCLHDPYRWGFPHVVSAGLE